MLRWLAMRAPAVCVSSGAPCNLKSYQPQAWRTLAAPCHSHLQRVPLLSRCSGSCHWLGATQSMSFSRHSTVCAAAGSSNRASPTAAVAILEEKIEEKELHVEASESYLAYAMSVIVGRALPDVRDGLKPVHRRILYAMHDLGISHSKPYKKCARVVGEVLGKYHPHGDSAVYDALVRLAQDFSMQLPLVSGHGNFGSLDDDPPAAMRYTECRLAAASEDLLLADLEADTVDFAPTFDASQEEPLVLPAKVPHLLVNGAQGIAVGIATKIPPHNLHEVTAALRALVAEPDISSQQLMHHIPAPDFPTGGELIVGPETEAAYATGNGSVLLRATAAIEYEDSSGTSGKKRGSNKSRAAGQATAQGGGNLAQPAAPSTGGHSGRALVVFSEMPYQVCKSDLVTRIAEMVEAKQLDGIADVRDESDRSGVRLVVEVKRGFSPEVVLNQLYKNTRLQQRFAANMVALVGGVPKTLTLKDFLVNFLAFREEVVQRRARHRLARAQVRLHLVEGLLVALQQLDQVVQAIRGAPDGPAAKVVLVSGFGLTDTQAEGVLAMTLRRLTGLEANKLKEEQDTLLATIADLQDLLSDRQRILQLVLDEAQAVADKHGQPRRSRIVMQAESSGAAELKDEDVVPNTPSLITVSSKGFIKRMPSSTWEPQKRGGKGKSSAKLRDNDALEDLLSLMAHDTLLFLSSAGRAYAVKAYKVPEASRAAAGSSISQVLGLRGPERFPSLLPVSSFDDAGMSLAMATSTGGLKRTPLAAFANIKRGGLAAVKLAEAEQLAAAALAADGCNVILASSGGKLSHLRISTVRQSSRAAGCIKGMKLLPGESLVSMTVLPSALSQQLVAAHASTSARSRTASSSLTEAADVEQQQQEEQAVAANSSSNSSSSSSSNSSRSSLSDGPWLLLVTSRGYGKRVLVKDVPLKLGRGTQGVSGIKLEKGDSLAVVLLVSSADDDVALASRQGMVARLSAADVRVCGRSARGVRVISLNEGDEVQTVTVVPAEHRTALA